MRHLCESREASAERTAATAPAHHMEKISASARDAAAQDAGSVTSPRWRDRSEGQPRLTDVQRCSDGSLPREWVPSAVGDTFDVMLDKPEFLIGVRVATTATVMVGVGNRCVGGGSFAKGDARLRTPYRSSDESHVHACACACK